jgi:phytoene synthase
VTATRGTRDQRLRASYATCRQLTKAHGTTYYWSTRLLPRDRQRHVFALYAFCRHADEIVDDLGDASLDARAAALAQLHDQLLEALARGHSDHDVLAAVVDTSARFDIDPDCYERFLRSMTMDLTIAEYESYDDLLVYMDGSAAVIGEMMLPILEPLDPAATEPARALGLAFQLTNFLRDVSEDLDRGRVYLPQEDVRRFGADPWRRRVTPEWRALMRFEIARTRDLYELADTGVSLLPDRSGRCIHSARRLYAGILDEIEANDYDVFSARVRVPLRRKLTTVASTWVASVATEATPSRTRRGTTGTENPNGG